MEPKLRELGQALAEVQDRAPCPFDVEKQSARFLLHARSDERRPVRQRLVLAFSLGAALCALCAALLATRGEPRRATFQVGGIGAKVGAWIAAPSERALPLSFSDGSQLVLERRARARVIALGEHGARIVLEHGALSAHVVHREDCDWRVDAGPFEVRVIGTRFELSWDAEQEKFAITLREGAVRVLGASLPGGRTVRAGERLVLGPAQGASPVAAPAPAPSVQLARPLPSARPRAQQREGVAHARAGEVPAEEAFESILKRAGPTELTTLADRERFSGRPAQAVAALSALRTRFPEHDAASDAAFFLGRLCFDQLGAVGDAAQWFETYLRERPLGVFAREAAGRLIECYRSLHDRAAARAAAQRYLARYPQGPHASIARAALDPANVPAR